VFRGLGGKRETLYWQRIRRMRAAWHVARRRDRRVSYRVLVGGSAEGKRKIGRHRRRGEDNIKIDM